MDYNTIGFTLFKKCNASCDICCFESHPNAKECLDIKHVKSYINQSGEVGGIKTVSFSGGEPFLEYDLLYKLISLAKDNKKTSSCVTNGFWANDYKTTFNVLMKLKRAGLNKLSVSHDNHHKKYVQTGNIKNIIRVSSELGINIILAVVKLKNEQIKDIIDDLGELIYHPKIKIVPCSPIGNALKYFKADEFDRTLSINGLKCPHQNVLEIFYDGMIYPCCSQMISQTSFAIGNFKDMSLKEALKRSDNEIINLMNEDGMDFFVGQAKAMSIKIPNKVVSPCELCTHIFKPKIINNYKNKQNAILN